MFFPRRRDVGPYTREYVLDHLVVSTWLVTWPSAIVAATWLLSGKTAGLYELASSVLFCCVVPFLTFSTLMSSVIYLHHMHPQVGWVPGDARVDASRMQMLSAVHVIFPYYTNLVFHRIMEHTAHHMRPGIPMYHLDNGQTVLEETFPEIVVQIWSPRSHLDTLARCKLFDLERGCWVGYDGVPTAPAIGPAAAIRPATVAAPFEDRPYRDAAA
jgi:omega-6 fatty acid desaturase (delta-12 desaturase)